MSYKHFNAGPWLQTDKELNYDRTRLLLDYPERYIALFNKRDIDLPAQTDWQEEIAVSLLTELPKVWWTTMEFPDRRTAGYKAAAAGVAYPVLAHELADLVRLVPKLQAHAEDSPFVLLPVHLEANGVGFGDQVLATGTTTCLIKFASGDDIERRCWQSDWPAQLFFASWLRHGGDVREVNTHPAKVLVVDELEPGRVIALTFPAPLITDLCTELHNLPTRVAQQLKTKPAATVTRGMSPPPYYRGQHF